MKRVIGVGLLGVLVLSMMVSCEPENENKSSLKNYTETAFGMNLEMVYVQGGTFEMGATAEQDEDAFYEEYPVRTIKLDGYYIGKYELTQAQWKAVMGTSLREQRDKANPAWGIYGEGDSYPMGYVSWEEAREFCQKLSEATGRRYMLPTEAQWEYAARGGNKSRHYKYAGGNNIDEVAWYKENSDNTAHSVGTKKANELGCYDMSGNVMEWCSDWYGRYVKNDTVNPQGPARGTYRVHRVCSWLWEAKYLRVSSRSVDTATGRFFDVGFRVACSL
ncbi:MAG: formylglycine-generating enzyme family protein [Bacteroidales bacterium]|nr:formylglycine-generating enzyme family protein [Bacteroidales bacterium]